ncbi:hypothetical protein DCCM_4742 [Desulfocucumis palustris]|uniref:Ribbon-helix-helix protein CopG domain-containing protein n=1 Tax=Desulfocucumis palustris TaxID=1898651 RepID=A0A2L2XIT0_9FIRM|nr:hypothetical protein [Desulfocucumis palustris]GBF35613.1 hypothetical protein DCCM_4742 [Desulfocucumis palustris]
MANAYGRPKAYVSFQVRISPELKERLARRSFETGVSQAAIVIASLEHYLETGLTPKKEQEEDMAGSGGGEAEEEVL